MSLLYKAVRDGIRYNPYVKMTTPETFRASSVVQAGNGYCVGRRRSTPPPAAFTTFLPGRLCGRTQPSDDAEAAGDDGHRPVHLARFHQVYVDGAWRKATPTFNASLCEKLNVHPLDFDGHEDALLHQFDGAGRTFMRYEVDHGTFHDVPAEIPDARNGAHLHEDDERDLSSRDMELEAQGDRPCAPPTSSTSGRCHCSARCRRCISTG